MDKLLLAGIGLFAVIPLTTIIFPRAFGPVAVIAMTAAAGWVLLYGGALMISTAVALWVGAALLAGLLAIERRLGDRSSG